MSDLTEVDEFPLAWRECLTKLANIVRFAKQHQRSQDGSVTGSIPILKGNYFSGHTYLGHKGS